MKITASHLRNLKETLLVITVIYFYGLAFALGFDKPTFGADQPSVFLFMAGLFFFALALEGILTWWDRSRAILWWTLWILSYAVIGFVVAPRIFGQGVLIFVYLEPVIVALVGGFAFAAGWIVAGEILPAQRLSAERIRARLTRLPGWELHDDAIARTYAFKDFSDALNFVNRAARALARSPHLPAFDIRFEKVTVTCTTPDGQGVTERDLFMAHQVDAL